MCVHTCTGSCRPFVSLGTLHSDLKSSLSLHAGVTSENVASKYGVTRAAQDKMAARSHARALSAQQSGRFDSEIVPVKTLWIDPKTGEEKHIVVAKDDGIREGVTPASLSKLRPVFKKDGTTTAGNSSQVRATAHDYAFAASIQD